MRLPSIMRWSLPAVLVASFMTGCAKPPEEAQYFRLDPNAPAARGYSPRPLPGAPAPLSENPPFGLYATYPSTDTLTNLSAGEPSPDGRFRAAVTTQGAWVARVDGGWLWQVPEPAAPKTPAQAIRPVETPGAIRPATDATTVFEPLTATQVRWTPRSTLLVQDEDGRWYEGDPVTTQVKSLPPALQGKEIVAFSPDASQILYLAPARVGTQLWLAKADGSDPKYQGENVTGAWDPSGKLIITKLPLPPAPLFPSTPPTTILPAPTTPSTQPTPQPTAQPAPQPTPTPAPQPAPAPAPQPAQPTTPAPGPTTAAPTTQASSQPQATTPAPTATPTPAAQ